MSESKASSSAASSARRAARRKDPAAKLRLKITRAIKSENYYLAEQLTHSQYNRMKATNLKGGLELLYTGAKDLLKARQGNEGGSLGLTYVQEMMEFKCKPTPEDIVRIQSLFVMFPAEDIKPRLEFMKEAIQWTAKYGPCPYGDPKLHNDLARFHDQAKEFSKANKHYVRGTRPLDHARCVLTWAQKGYPSELDMFVARAVFEYLCLENLKDANTFFQACLKEIDSRMVSQCEEKGESVDDVEDKRTPLINFVDFLLQTVERDALPLFDMLCSKYKPSIRRDPSFENYLIRIAKVYFGRSPPKGMLEELMGMLAF